MKVRLTPEMREFAEAEIAAGHYLDLSDVVRAAMRRLMEERGAAAAHRSADEVGRGGGPARFDSKDCRVIGRWRIVAADLWDRDYLDLVGPATLVVRADGHGEIAFGALDAGLRAAAEERERLTDKTIDQPTKLRRLAGATPAPYAPC